jgi:ABC-type polysaccharide/polyol phosphate transport system ATPase subunit
MAVTTMTPGRIVVDRVSQRFSVATHPQRTLKDLFVARGRRETREVWALRDVSLTVDPGEAVGLVGRNGSGKTTLLKLVSHIFKPTAGRIETGGRVASLLELGAGFHPDFTGRENVYLNGSIYGLSRARVNELMDEIVAFAELERSIDLPVRTYSSGMYMRLGFSVAAHLQADVLLLDEVFAVGDEAFQRKCFGKIAEFKRRGGTIVFVSHDAQAVEMLCDRAVLLKQGEVAFDGKTREAIARYRQLLSADASPDELAAGLREWGSGEARVVSARLLDLDGDERRQFAAGEPFVVELRVATDADVPAPQLSLELRDDDGVALGGVTVATSELGWDARAGERELRFEVDRLPLAEGRFHLRCALLDGDGGRLLHSLGDAGQFFVVPTGAETGAVLLAGRWSMQEIGASEPIGLRQ